MNITYTMQDVAMVYMICSFFVLPVILYYFVRSERFKKMKFWLRHIPYIKVVFIDGDNNPSYDIKKIGRHGTKEFFEDSDKEYGYSPIANGLCIVETGNAIPCVRGGYVEEKAVKEATKKLSLDITPEKMNNPQTPKEEDDTQTVLRFIISDMPKEFKNVIIRPFVKWSAKELKEAIRSKVITDLLSTELSTMDLILMVLVVASLGVAGFFGYTNMQNTNNMQQTINALQKALEELSKYVHQNPIPI